jgi:short-subunit dehydrogenase
MMTKRTWVLLGATSVIAEHFAHLAAKNGYHLRLVGRDLEQLTIIAQDIQLRFNRSCELLVCDLTQRTDILLNVLDAIDGEFDLFMAHSDFSDNDHLNNESIHNLIQINVLATALLINYYLHLDQKEHHILYLSSVASCRGRSKNSLYGGTKAAIEIYLQGLQQAALPTQHITIAKLGFIDTKQTYGVPGVFYAAPPKQCAQACWDAMKKHKRFFYYPKFWRMIMIIIQSLPFFLYKKMGKI